MEKTKVIILGGGIGGLSAAHELSKHEKFDITLIERNKHLGGQAAESKTNKNNLHTAVCWHAISSSYKYFLNIMDEIVDDKNIKVISHLHPLINFIYAFGDRNYVEKDNSFVTRDFKNIIDGITKLYGSPPPKKDIRRLKFIYLYANSLSDAHLEKYDKVLWKDYIKDMSPNVKKWIYESTSIYLGMDYNKLSVHFMFNLLRKQYKTTKLDNNHTFYSFDGSMLDLLFNPWKALLEKRGVKFLMEHEVVGIFQVPGLSTISTISVLTDTKELVKYSADIFINAMDVKNIGRLYPSCDQIDDVTSAHEILPPSRQMLCLSTKEQKYKFNTLYNDSYQIQTQVVYYLPYRLQPNYTGPTILIIPDSQWFLMVRIEGDIFQLKNNDILSCGIGIWDRPGINGKAAINCTRQEIAEECWLQITNSQHNLKLGKKIPKWNIWKSFTFNILNGCLDTYEPKFSNNINTLALRPRYNDDIISNLYHATAYTRTNMNIYNMESAAEAGVKVADMINKKIEYMIDNMETLSKNCMKKYIKFRNNKDDDDKIKWYFRFARKIDSIITNLFRKR